MVVVGESGGERQSTWGRKREEEGEKGRESEQRDIREREREWDRDIGADWGEREIRGESEWETKK
jgi:hypothetical protein